MGNFKKSLDGIKLNLELLSRQYASKETNRDRLQVDNEAYSLIKRKIDNQMQSEYLERYYQLRRDSNSGLMNVLDKIGDIR